MGYETHPKTKKRNQKMMMNGHRALTGTTQVEFDLLQKAQAQHSLEYDELRMMKLKKMKMMMRNKDVDCFPP